MRYRRRLLIAGPLSVWFYAVDAGAFWNGEPGRHEPSCGVDSSRRGQGREGHWCSIERGGARRVASASGSTRGVFTYQGKPVDRCSTKAWKRALERAGIEHSFRWHDLRHTWASWHVQSGTPLQELMELGSWASYDMVLRYAHLASDHLREAASRIDGTFLTHKQKPQLVRLS